MLQKTEIDSAARQSKDYFKWDDKVSGFGVKIGRSGKKTFVFQYRNKYGRNRRLKIGDYGPWTVQKARARASQLRNQVDVGEDPADEKAALRKTMTVGEMLDCYTGECLPAKGCKSIAKTKRAVDRYIRPRIGSLPVLELDTDVVQSLVNSLRDKPAVANHVKAYISAAFNYARSKKYVNPASPNPCEFVKCFKLNKDKRIIMKEEYAKVSTAIKRLWVTKPGYRPELLCIKLILLTGCRIKEARRLKWAEVDASRGWIVLEDHKTAGRSDEQKVIPIVPPIEDVLEQARQLRKELGFISPYVFPHIEKKGKPRKAEHVDGSLTRVWKLIREETKTTLKLKNSRSSYISRAGREGYHVELIAELMHHATPETTRRYYLEFEEDRKREAAATTAESIGGDMES